jgi:Domain of unknown function (DUF4386)
LDNVYQFTGTALGIFAAVGVWTSPDTCEISYQQIGAKRMNDKKISSSPKRAGGIANNHHRQIALIAGFGLLLMTVFIILAEVVAMADIIVDGDAAVTVENIINNQSRFRFGIVAYLGVAILDLVVAWAFYVFLKPAKDNLSLLAAWSRLVYTIILGMALVNLYIVVQVLGNAAYLSAFEAPQIQAQVMLLLGAFRDTWDVGYVFFGLHLFIPGIAAFRSGIIPKVIGVILTAAGISYLIDYLGWMLFPELSLGVSYIFGYGELIFMVWLLIWGGKEGKTKNKGMQYARK